MAEGMGEVMALSEPQEVEGSNEKHIRVTWGGDGEKR
jgi:hypothetical protein